MPKTGKTLAESGELAFIQHIRKSMPPDGGMFPRSVGDDCLIAESFGTDQIIATTDTFVDGVHFTRELMTFKEAGARFMTAAVSDIAAMSGLPSFSLVSLSMPKSITFDDAVSLFDGLRETADAYGCPVTGGETTSTPGPVTVTVTVIGRVEPGKAVTRSGARIGDGIYITGTIGDAMAGLKTLLDREDGFASLKRKFICPAARVNVSRALADKYAITAMIDVSDGVTTELGHICEESGCGALLDALSIPLSREFSMYADSHKIMAVESALSSGEEFEVLFTSGDTSIPDKFELEGVAVTKIGVIVESDRGLAIKSDDAIIKLSHKGYEHFTEA